jgi:ribosomal-protein-alanine N-acetyltransferase
MIQRTDYAAWDAAQKIVLPKQNAYDVLADADRSRLDEAAFVALVDSYLLLSRFGVITLGVFSKSAPFIVGQVMYSNISRNIVQSARLSFAIFNNQWRKGFAREILIAGIMHSFGTLKFHRLEFWIHPNNVASLRLVKSMRTRKECLKRQALFIDGNWQDHIVFYTMANKWGATDLKPQILI